MPALGAESLTKKVSAPSDTVSLPTGTVKVAEDCPWAKFRIPDLLV
jgi:hypothetical protein